MGQKENGWAVWVPTYHTAHAQRAACWRRARLARPDTHSRQTPPKTARNSRIEPWFEQLECSARPTFNMQGGFLTQGGTGRQCQARTAAVLSTGSGTPCLAPWCGAVSAIPFRLSEKGPALARAVSSSARAVVFRTSAGTVLTCPKGVFSGIVSDRPGCSGSPGGACLRANDSRERQVGPELYRQSGTWSDYTESKLVSNYLPIREVTRAIRPTGRFNRSNLPNQTCLPLYLGLRVSKSIFT